MISRHGVTEFLDAFRHFAFKFYELEPDLLVVLDGDGEIIRVNPAFVEVTGRRERDVQGLSIVRLVAEADLSKFMRSFDLDRDGAAFRLLRAESGTVEVRLVRFFFDHRVDGTRVRNKEGYLILRSSGYG